MLLSEILKLSTDQHKYFTLWGNVSVSTCVECIVSLSHSITSIPFFHSWDYKTIFRQMWCHKNTNPHWTNPQSKFQKHSISYPNQCSSALVYQKKKPHSSPSVHCTLYSLHLSLSVTLSPSSFLSQSVQQGVEEVRRPAMDYHAALNPLDSSLACRDYVCASPGEANLSETWRALISWPIRHKRKPQDTPIPLCTDPFPPPFHTLSLSYCKA